MTTVSGLDVPEALLLRWSEALSGIARTGLAFTQSLYERERFEEVLKVAADIRVARRPLRPSGKPRMLRATEEWLKLVGEGVPGYVTPKLAVGAVVGNDAGEILLVQRSDSGVWLYPTGWADVGYSPAEVVVKEVAEETGIDVEPVRLVAVLDGLRLGFTRIPLVSLVFHCRALGGALPRIRWNAPMLAGSPRTGCPRPSPASIAGRVRPSPRSVVNRSRFCSIRPETALAGRGMRKLDGNTPHSRSFAP